MSEKKEIEERQVETLFQWSTYNSKSADNLASRTATQLIITATFVVTFSSAFFTSSKTNLLVPSFKSILVVGWSLEALSIVCGFTYFIWSQIIYLKISNDINKILDEFFKQKKKLKSDEVDLEPTPFWLVGLQLGLTVVGLILIIIFASRLLFLR